MSKPAFPRPFSKVSQTGDELIGEQLWDQTGMTQRQWYKGMTLLGELPHNDGSADQIAKFAGVMADAMILEDEAFEEKEKNP